MHEDLFDAIDTHPLQDILDGPATLALYVERVRQAFHEYLAVGDVYDLGHLNDNLMHSCQQEVESDCKRRDCLPVCQIYLYLYDFCF